MLQYLIILLDDVSVPYCGTCGGQQKSQTSKLMPLDTLKKGIVWAMKENLNTQFVYPDYALPSEYEEVIESIDHIKIKPEEQSDHADVLVLTRWKERISEHADNATCIVHASRKELSDHIAQIEQLLGKVQRLNIELTDISTFSDSDIDDYKSLLEQLADMVVIQYKQGHSVQLNILTDRMFLEQMNNCGAGDTNITLAPNGKFYLCPAFYHSDPNFNTGNLETGFDVKNQQLLKLSHAPLCRRCDAFQCKRCVWMNQQLTMDCNTPSHQQCVVAHLERNASRELRGKLVELGIDEKELQPIEEIDYLDPFNIYNRWK